MAEFHWRKKRLLSKDENKNKKTKKEKDNSFKEIALTKMAKRQLLVTLLSIFGVTFVAFGSAFAVFTTSVKEEDYNTIAVGTLNITFGTESTIDLNGQYPVTDAVGLASTAYTFTIKNTGTLAASYTVHIQDDTDMISQDGCSGSQLDKNYIKYSLDGKLVNILGNMANNNNYQIASDTLEAGASKTYTIRVWIANGAPNSILNTHYHGKIVVNGTSDITSTNTSNAATTLIAKANALNIDNYTAGVTTEMYTFSHDQTSQTASLMDFRYIGSNPNNYVTFNDETWRIIGVFLTEKEDGTTEYLTKIIRNDSIGTYAWDNKITSSGGSNYSGSSDWTTARLMKLLNPGYESESIGGSLYYNSSSGRCYTGSNNAYSSCNFTTTGLDETSRNMTESVKWYLGALPDAVVWDGGSSLYNDERGTQLLDNSYSENWIGKVGLLYPSDYAYTFAYGVQDSCYNDPDSCTISNAITSYLYKGTSTSSITQWTMSPMSTSYTNMYTNFLAGISGSIHAISISGYSSTAIIRPVLYLKSSVNIVDGTGTSSDPYILELS